MAPLDRPPVTLGAQARTKLDALAGPLGLGSEADAIAEQIRELLGDAADRPLEAPPAWPSDICDDHGPFEFSVSMNRKEAVLRVLVESGPEPPTFARRQQAARNCTESLLQHAHAKPDRVRAIEGLFESDCESAQFARWHALEFRPGGRTDAKVYFNPLLQGSEHSRYVIRESLVRLGLDHAWPWIERLAGRDVDELKYFSLDLSDAAQARVKIYVRHPAIDATQLEAALAGCRGVARGQTAAFLHEMTGSLGPFTANPVITCLSWAGREQTPSATLHVPIRGYATDDQVAFDRIYALLSREGLPAATYAAAVRAFAGRALDAGVGMQSYASIKRNGDGPNVTVYLVPETYRVSPRRAVAHAMEARP
ncbi:MAG: hypothetical protein K1X88_35550 [Nannocystaceae bacterium]|nr:hypothetical protein [Nannocystaceae bacterium]